VKPTIEALRLRFFYLLCGETGEPPLRRLVVGSVVLAHLVHAESEKPDLPPRTSIFRVFTPNLAPGRPRRRHGHLSEADIGTYEGTDDESSEDDDHEWCESDE
jgi:hypothetical protein